MRTLQTTSLRVVDNQLWILDQHALPQQQNWLLVTHSEELIDHIKNLRVRGAPLIGIAASIFLALQAAKGASLRSIKTALVQLKEARPTAVNLVNNLSCLQVALQQQHWRDALQIVAWKLVDEDRALCQRIAEFGCELITPNSQVLTLCNTGSLATVGCGTALGVISRGWHNKNVRNVWVSETRPLLQGGRLTMWELEQQNINCQLITDNMAAALMAQGKVDAVWIGADRIALNGDVANKIGSYNLAVLANYHQIPFYVAAPYTSIDFSCSQGKLIPIEQRAAFEITGVKGSFGQVQWAPEQSKVWNPAFDITPASLISRWVTDYGVITPDAVKAGCFSDMTTAR